MCTTPQAAVEPSSNANAFRYLSIEWHESQTVAVAIKEAAPAASRTAPMTERFAKESFFPLMRGLRLKSRARHFDTEPCGGVDQRLILELNSNAST